MSAESEESLIKKMRKWKGQLEKRGLNVNVGKTESPSPRSTKTSESPPLVKKCVASTTTPVEKRNYKISTPPPARQKNCGDDDYTSLTATLLF